MSSNVSFNAATTYVGGGGGGGWGEINWVLIFCLLSKCCHQGVSNYLVYLMLPLSQIGFELFCLNANGENLALTIQELSNIV